MIVVKTAPNKLWRGTDKAFRLFGESIDWVWLKGEANALAVASANNANAAHNDASRAAPRLPTLSAVLTPPVHMFRPDLFRPLKAASYQGCLCSGDRGLLISGRRRVAYFQETEGCLDQAKFVAG